MSSYCAVVRFCANQQCRSRRPSCSPADRARIIRMGAANRLESGRRGHHVAGEGVIGLGEDHALRLAGGSRREHDGQPLAGTRRRRRQRPLAMRAWADRRQHGVVLVHQGHVQGRLLRRGLAVASGPPDGADADDRARPPHAVGEFPCAGLRIRGDERGPEHRHGQPERHEGGRIGERDVHGVPALDSARRQEPGHVGGQLPALGVAPLTCPAVASLPYQERPATGCRRGPLPPLREGRRNVQSHGAIMRHQSFPLAVSGRA